MNMKSAFKNLISKEILHLRWVIVAGLLLNAALSALLVITYRYMGKIVGELPPEMLEMLSKYRLARELTALFSNYPYYVWSQWNAKNLTQLLAVISIVISSIQFASENSKKTIGFYLTRPIRRAEGFTAKLSAGAAIIFAIFGGGAAVMWLASRIAGYDADWGRFFAASFISIVWGLVFYSATSIISVLFSDPIPAAAVSGACALLLFAPGMFEKTRSLSVFYHMSAVEYYVLGKPPFLSTLAAVALCSVLFAAGLKIFEKKDF